ncbi:MAG: hypothetical protein PHO65_01280 [Sulfurovum sp.]|nr:hypothetical protein [Sulfurovum sp.]
MIKLAISIRDIETIQLQISNLRLLRADPKIQKIIDALESESYAQSQVLIQEYMDNQIEEVHHHVPEENKKRTYTAREQALIDQFDLFVIDDNQEKEDQNIDVDRDRKKITAASFKKTSGPDLDRLLEMDEEPSRREKHTFKRTYTAREQALIDQFDLFVIDDNQVKEDQNIDVDRDRKKITAASTKKPSGPDLDRLLEVDEEPSKREKDILSQEDPHFSLKDTQAENRGPKSSINDDAFYIEEKQWGAPAGAAQKEPLESTAVSEKEKEIEAERTTTSQKTATISEAQAFSEKIVGMKENDINYRPIFLIEHQLHGGSLSQYSPHAKSIVPSDSLKEQINTISDEDGCTKNDVKKVECKAEEYSSAQCYEIAELLLLCGLMEDEFRQLTPMQTISAISEKEA